MLTVQLLYQNKLETIYTISIHNDDHYLRPAIENTCEKLDVLYKTSILRLIITEHRACIKFFSKIDKNDSENFKLI